jgi:hypothetical protein
VLGRSLGIQFCIRNIHVCTRQRSYRYDDATDDDRLHGRSDGSVRRSDGPDGFVPEGDVRRCSSEVSLYLHHVRSEVYHACARVSSHTPDSLR